MEILWLIAIGVIAYLIGSVSSAIKSDVFLAVKI